MAQEIAAFRQKVAVCLAYSHLATTNFVRTLCDELALTLYELKAKRFADQETFFDSKRLREYVSDKTVMLIWQYAPGSTMNLNEQLFDLLLGIDLLKRAGSTSIDLIIPYLPYSRQERDEDLATQGALDLIIRLLLSAHVDSIIACDLHVPSSLTSYDTKVVHLPLSGLWASCIKNSVTSCKDDQYVIASPDQGGRERARHVADLLKVPFVSLHKERYAPDMSREVTLEGSVEGASVIVIDDILDTAQTATNAAATLRKAGAQRIIGCFSHALFSGSARERIIASSFEAIYITDSVIESNTILSSLKNVSVIGLAHFIADALKERYGYD